MGSDEVQRDPPVDRPGGAARGDGVPMRVPRLHLPLDHGHRAVPVACARVTRYRSPTVMTARTVVPVTGGVWSIRW